MTTLVRRATAVALPLAISAQAAWAQSTAASPAATGAGSFHDPVWNGYGPGPWMMGGWGGGPMMGYAGAGWMMMLMMLFGGAILVALLVFIFRALAWSTHPPHQTLPYPGHGLAGLHALDERYGRGEINREEYLLKKRDILGQ